MAKKEIIYSPYKLLIFSIAFLSLFLTGCSSEDGGNQAMNEKIDRITINAKKKLISMITTQEAVFAKQKSFVIITDQKGQEPSFKDWVIGDPQSCYGYYTRAQNVKSNTNINYITDSIFVYAFQDACKGHWGFPGFTLNLYVGAVFAVKVPDSKQLKMVSVICKENNTAYLSRKNLSLPEYTSGVLKCPSKTTKVYFNDSNNYPK
ncbi:hypothetical protein [Nostoc sp. DSM 114167]|jgi:hypothetical protein|uniref:hypothetical protein n=1 Tax=Nostoc sp. DSM 114167 TaxID=3439050 RepID=UPI0040454FF2